MRHLAATLLVVAAAVPATSLELVVFRKDGPYKGAAMRVVSYEAKNGKLLLKGEDGNVFSVAEDQVDWERSQELTSRLLADEAKRAEARAAEEKAQAEASRPRPKEMSVVEASRRYGVEHPGMSVAAGSAAKSAPASSAPARGEGGAKAAPAGGAKASAANVPDTPESRRIKERLARTKADRDKVAKDLELLKADTNPDPLSASMRQTAIPEKTKQLADLDGRIAGYEKQLEEMAESARKAAEEKTKAAEAAAAAASGNGAPSTPAPAGR